MSEASVLAVEALTKIYSDGRHNITVLNHLQLEIASGEWLAVVGASGAGNGALRASRFLETLGHVAGGSGRVTRRRAPRSIRPTSSSAC